MKHALASLAALIAATACLGQITDVTTVSEATGRWQQVADNDDWLDTNKQPADADLDYWAGYTPSSFVQSLLDDADAAAFLATLGIEAGATADQTGAEIEALLDTELGGTTWKTGGGGLTSADIDTQAKVNAIRTDLITVGITASTTQTQGQGALTAATNYVATVANANDTVTLWDATTGARQVVYNDGANTLQVFPASGETIGALALNASTTIPAGEVGVFEWKSATAINATISSSLRSSLTDDQVYSETFTILEPDAVRGVSDDIVLKKFTAESYPNGVTITAIHIDASSAYTSETFLFEHWDNASGSTQATVESITASAISTEDDGTLSDATIPADYFLVVNLDDTPEDVAYVAITVCYTID